MIRLKNEKDVEILRISGKILAGVLRALKKEVQVGVSLSDLDTLARELMAEKGARPAFLGYRSEGSKKAYPAAICTSVNEVVVHGLPSDYKLKDGDLLKIDAGVDFKGYITDSAITVAVGSVSKSAKNLMNATEKALSEGIKVARAGNRVGDIGCAIQKVAEKYEVEILRGLTGHGVGFALHEDPTIWNYGVKDTGVELVPGLVIAIEPMFSESSPSITQRSDESYASADGSLTAQFEHTVLITKRGAEILTRF